MGHLTAISLVLLLVVLGCEKHFRSPVTRSVTDPSTKTTKQLGDAWDRALIEKSGFENTLFLGGSEFEGRVGQFVYLGTFQDQHLFMTVKHVVNESEDLCDRLVNIKNADNKVILDCSPFILSLVESDVSIVAMKPRPHFQIESLVPVRLQKTVRKGDRLQLLTRSHENSQIYSDTSPDCSLLSDNPQKISDPDASDESQISSWSLPVGCDAEHGDSGAPVLNHQNEVVGIIWTGKFPKALISSQSLKEVLKAQGPSLWTDFNYIVPVSKIVEEIEKKLANGELSEEIQKPISELLKTLVVD
jgi:hypothetical protein